MPHVLIYTTPTCGYCKLAKAFFKEHNVAYEEIDITTDPSKADEAVQKSGQTGVPVIDIAGQIIVGFQPELFQAALKH